AYAARTRACPCQPGSERTRARDRVTRARRHLGGTACGTVVAVRAIMLARRDRILGCLLGTALGDAAGLPFEGLSAARVARRLGDAPLDLPRRALVSDDTEQTALIAAALARSRAPAELGRHVVRGFRR